MDIAIMLTLVGSFAILCTTHLSLALGLMRKRPRYKGVLALLVVPLAPYFGHTANMRFRSALWIAAFCLYILALVAASVEGG